MNLLSIRTRLIFVLSLILLSGFFLTNVISYQASKRSVKTSIIESSLPLARDNIYSEIQKDLTRPIFVSSLMANDTFLKDWVLGGEGDQALIQKYLLEIKDKYHFFTSFFVSDISKTYYHFKGTLKKISPDNSQDAWYFNFKKLQVEYDLNVDTNEAQLNHLTIFINHRLEGYDNQLLGVVGVGLDFDRVATLMDYYKKKYNRDIYMVSPDGLIQVHTDKEKITTLSIFDIPGLGSIARRILDSKDTPSFFEYDSRTAHILLTSRFIPELGWYLLVEQDETLALESIKNTFVKNFLISLVITFATIIFAILVINYFQRQLETMANTDKLTRAYNRNEFERQFKYMTNLNRREPVDMCIILFDMDHLKQVNDTHGHLFGDTVIKAVADIAAQTIRQKDLLVRWGGDEFVLLIFSTLAQTRQIAERLRMGIQTHNFYKNALSVPPENNQPITISCGIARYREKETLKDWVMRADTALYRAKARGKNCIEEAMDTKP
ncbi:MAG: sensor domain-containing diguanylate cyclase [Proteobacteria bacterium]|nr:sensor domain-containing diguanylate cyclase [Pseudomonadota bacterium]MBU4131371.1 sensor domain-containing diguanylate cyclase [Pseudomonadota bacterium]